MSGLKKRILSGIQPSGNLTIGNYLGALRQWVAEQETYDCYYCVVDLHAITVPQDPESLRAKTREVAALYLACGLDPQKVTIFVQSHVHAHAELAWILTCFAPVGWLNRMTQFKDKSAKQNQESISAGLLNYPTLMAADIFLYQANAVPVGDDQRQHLEYARDLAQRFNHLYGNHLVVPEAMIPPEGARIMGLDDPSTKMSKSEASEHHAIYLLDRPDRVKKVIMRATTDSYSEIKFSDQADRAGINNLLTIYQAFTNQSTDSVNATFAGKGYGDLKRAVVDVVNDRLGKLQAEYGRIMEETGVLDKILSEGAEKASEVAEKTLQKVKDAVGLLSIGHK